MDGSGSQMQSLGGVTDNYHGKLACQACQRKKIKCSRTFPCEQCMRSSLQCVPSTRKPRTRHIGKRAVDAELRSRISKLESLVESLSGEVGGGADDSPNSETETVAEGKDPSAATEKYLGSPFWSTLTSEVQALREALQDEASEDEADYLSPTNRSLPPENSGKEAEYDLILCPPGVIYIMPGALTPPSTDVSAKLLDVFCENIDCLFRMFHTPSLRSMMLQDAPYLGHDANSPPNRAVKAAVWFSAINSMEDSECLQFFGQSRVEMLSHFRRHVQVALSQADLLNTCDLGPIQALVIYLATSRFSDTSRRTWTLAAVLVRLAHGLGLHHESTTRSFYETQIRRRLWFGVRFIDVWSSLDRGTEQLIDDERCTTPAPNNLNDDEFDENSTEIPERTTGMTDMSFTLMAHTACGYSAGFIKAEHKPNGMTWQQRLETAKQFVSIIEDKFLQYCDLSIPFQRSMWYVGKTMGHSMILRAVRPMQRHVSSVPPPVHSPMVLRMAMECLKSGQAILNDPEVQRWRWMVWVQWHALAITLAGLCFHRDSDLANEAWPLVEGAFGFNAGHVADTPNGMLWRPLQKLYKKAVAFRDHGTAGSTSTSPSITTEVRPAELSSKTSPRVASTADSKPALPNPNHQFAASASGSLPYNPGMPNNNGGSGFMLDPSLSLNAAQPAQPQLQGLPTNGADLDFDFNDPMFSTGMSFGNDMTMMDFERILEDMSVPAVDGALGDASWSNMAQFSSSGGGGMGWGVGNGVNHHTQAQ